MCAGFFPSAEWYGIDSGLEGVEKHFTRVCSKEKKKKKKKKGSRYKPDRAGRHSHPGGASGPASLNFEARQNHLSLGTGCMLGGLASAQDISK